ncbi:hypothetical protein [Algoriphagus namhaensis]
MDSLKNTFVLILSLLLCADLNAQSGWVIESKIGTGNTNVDFRGDFPDLSLSTTNHLFLNFGVYRKLKNNFYIGLEADIYRFDIGYAFLPLNLSNTGGLNANFFSFGPKIQKDIFLSENLGIFVGTGFHLSQTNFDEFEYTGIWQAIRLPNGEQKIPILLYGETDVTDYSFLIKPEVGFFYDFAKKSRLTLTSRWGVDLNEPSIVYNLDRIEYQNESFSNVYSFNGNYWSLLLGYRYSF